MVFLQLMQSAHEKLHNCCTKREGFFRSSKHTIVRRREIPAADFITHQEQLAIHYDLQYSRADRDCGDDKKCLRDKKHKADIKLIKREYLTCIESY